jgi:Mg2+ and Co2+ transporter CorA
MTRRRGYCPVTMVMKNGRCAVHGGKTPKAVTEVSKQSKSEYLPQAIYARFENLNTSVLDNLEESIKLQQTLETSIIERLDTGESALAWERLLDIMAATSLIDTGIPEEAAEEDEIVQLRRRVEQLETAIDSARQITQQGARSFAIQSELRKELQQAHDAQRKLTETLTKCRKEVQETYTEEQWNTLLLAVLTSLKRHVEAQALTAVVKDFQSFSAQKLLKAA